MVSTLYILNLFLMFVRLLAVFMTAPVFSSQGVPAMMKIGLAGVLALVLLPVRSANAGLAALPTTLVPLALLVGQEVLIGVLIGYVSNLVFAAVSVAASMMGIQLGFRAANLFNPFISVSTSSLEQFYTLTALVLFLTINGHHILLRALARTFDVVPIGTFVLTEVTIARLIEMTNALFVIAARIALPVMGTLLLVDLGLGLIARAVPQIQVFFVGLPLKIGLGFVIMISTVTLTLPFIRDLLAGMARDIALVVG